MDPQDIPFATIIADILQIREHNAQDIDIKNGQLGSAIAFKWTNHQQTNIPAILVFVVSKHNVPLHSQVPEYYYNKTKTLRVRTDVIEAMSREDYVAKPEVTDQNELLQNLRVSDRILAGGSQLHATSGSQSWTGTAACLVRRTVRPFNLCMLTNQHVADYPGTPIRWPGSSFNKQLIGHTLDARVFAGDEEHYDGIVDELNDEVRVDCAVVNIKSAEQTPVESGVIGLNGDPNSLTEITKQPFVLDLYGTLDQIIGLEVCSVGARRGRQLGTIRAFAYEFQDNPGLSSLYTDYLIEGRPTFSEKGDSGKLICLLPKVESGPYIPFALLWGGWEMDLSPALPMLKWTYAIQLSKALKYMKAEIV
jgi:hypothetical protein